MHLGVTGALKSLLPFGRRRAAAAHEDDHAYVRGDITARGPCPGLNSLANQGYLPRDGKNISLPQVETALKTALHMDGTLAHTLANTLRPLCRSDGTFDLVDMRRHDVIEHDRSMTRLDFHQGDNYTFQPHLFRALLADAGPGPDDAVTLRTLARSYRRRKAESKAAGAPGLPLNLWFVNLIQTVSFLHTADTGGRLSRDVMTTFYTEERFPDVILENAAKRTLSGLVGSAITLWFYALFRVGG